MEALLLLAGLLLVFFIAARANRSTPVPRQQSSQGQDLSAVRDRPKVGRAPPPAPQSGPPKHREIAPGPSFTGHCHVIDGDTIVVNKRHIRLFGIDAPEIEDPYGKKAKWALVRLTKGKPVTVTPSDHETYGRTVGHCHLPDGTDLSAEMTKQGLALDWAKFSGGRYRALETPDARKKLWRVDAKHRGRLKLA